MKKLSVMLTLLVLLSAQGIKANDPDPDKYISSPMPDEIPEVTLTSDDGQLGIAHLLKGAGLVSSTSEAFRMIKQGAVKIDGVRVEDRSLMMAAGTSRVYQVGKRKFARVLLK